MPVVECQKCGKPFKYSEKNFAGWDLMSLKREREVIDCPYCSAEYGAMVTTGSFESEKLSAEEEQAYLAQKGKQ